uniref:Putative regulator n=1 Tax=Marinomonas sp. (strain MWYL1) TaxID=400668 RepID=A6VTE6_MARMS
MHILRYSAVFIASLSIFSLSGCTDNFKSALDSVQIARELNKGTEITTEYIAATPYSSSLVTINDAKPILLILGLAEQNPTNAAYQLTWIAGDKGTIVTENGRIIHTTGFDTSNLETLLIKGQQLSLPGQSSSWQAIYDWSPGYRYNFSADITSMSLGMETIVTDLWTQQAEHIQEQVAFNSLNSKIINDFWVAPETNSNKPFVVKSIQYLGPNMDKVEMLMVKPFIEQKLNTTN